VCYRVCRILSACFEYSHCVFFMIEIHKFPLHSLPFLQTTHHLILEGANLIHACIVRCTDLCAAKREFTARGFTVCCLFLSHALSLL
jgi:hypothetical protein